MIDALKRSGLKENDDFYFWNYDWRKLVTSTKTDLYYFIDSKTGKSDKIVVIGHSLGGLVGRFWAQDFNDPRLEKVISLGSPFLGAVSAYDAWSLGKVGSDGFDLGSIALKVLVELKRTRNGSAVKALRDFAPMVGDLMPIFDFVKVENKVVSLMKMAPINFYLYYRVPVPAEIKSKFVTIEGTNFKTKEWINMGTSNFVGSYVMADGDGTVLPKSSEFGAGRIIKVNSSHMNLVVNSVNLILQELGYRTIPGLAYSNDNLDKKLIFFIGSPAYLDVKCDNEQSKISDVDGFVVIDDKNYKDCIVSVIGTGNGAYHLLNGQISKEDSWVYKNAETKQSKVDKYRVIVQSGAVLGVVDPKPTVKPSPTKKPTPTPTWNPKRRIYYIM